MSSRFLIVAPIAVVITAALFFLMRDLISGSSEKPDTAERPIIQIGRQIKDPPDPERRRTPPPVIEEPASQPAKIDHNSIQIPTDTRISKPRPIRPGDGNGGPGKIHIRPIDGSASPVFRNTQYPSCGKGVGDVLLEFVVDPDGTVSDVKVVSATSSCFSQAAVRAARSWRYRPEVVEGEAVRSARQRVKIQFVPES